MLVLFAMAHTHSQIRMEPWAIQLERYRVQAASAIWAPSIGVERNASAAIHSIAGTD